MIQTDMLSDATECTILGFMLLGPLPASQLLRVHIALKR
jgi:hypothetical protein